LNEIVAPFSAEGLTVQTKRILAPVVIDRFREIAHHEDLYFSVGAIRLDALEEQRRSFQEITKLSCNLDLTHQEPTPRHVDLLFDLARESPEKTFYFSYSFQGAPSSPYFPSATYATDGFSIGLQPTDLAAGCDTLEDWLDNMSRAWAYVSQLVDNQPGYLGIDSSVASLGSDDGSLVRFATRLYGSFQRSLVSDFYVRLTDFLKSANPRPVGLCGLMLPCLEDFELAREYESGRFGLVTNLFLSLNSGLGIDTYPIGIDEDPELVLDCLRLTRRLSLKYSKPLSVRFVSDGKARIGEMTRFENSFLRDVVARPLTPSLHLEVEA
jgi:hypothetical protein